MKYVILEKAIYPGNIGIIELFKFYKEATPELVKKVKDLIEMNKNKSAMDIVQKFLNVKLHGALSLKPSKANPSIKRWQR